MTWFKGVGQWGYFKNVKDLLIPLANDGYNVASVRTRCGTECHSALKVRGIAGVCG